MTATVGFFGDRLNLQNVSSLEHFVDGTTAGTTMPSENMSFISFILCIPLHFAHCCNSQIDVPSSKTEVAFAVSLDDDAL